MFGRDQPAFVQPHKLWRQVHARVRRSVGKARSESCEQSRLLDKAEANVLEQQRLRAHVVDVLFQPRDGVCEVQALHDDHDDDGLNHLM